MLQRNSLDMLRTKIFEMLNTNNPRHAKNWNPQNSFTMEVAIRQNIVFSQPFQLINSINRLIQVFWSKNTITRLVDGRIDGFVGQLVAHRP